MIDLYQTTNTFYIKKNTYMITSNIFIKCIGSFSKITIRIMHGWKILVILLNPYSPFSSRRIHVRIASPQYVLVALIPEMNIKRARVMTIYEYQGHHLCYRALDTNIIKVLLFILIQFCTIEVTIPYSSPTTNVISGSMDISVIFSGFMKS